MRVPAVVGSWPEPFVHGFTGTRSRCGRLRRARQPARRCASGSPAGVRPAGGVAGSDPVLVGPWAAVRERPRRCAAREGPADSGVFASSRDGGGFELEGLDQQGQPAGRIGPGGGLVAATAPRDAPPAWVVTGDGRRGRGGRRRAARTRRSARPLRGRDQAGRATIAVPVR